AVLVALNELYGAGLTQRELCDIGKGVGADVPFSIIGGTARVRGIGEIIEPIDSCPPCWFCVCMPNIGISTPAAYARYDEYGAKRHPNSSGAQAAIKNKDLNAMAACLYNVLQECSESCHNDNICNILNKNGAMASLMTGSGAAVFGVFATKREAIAAIAMDFNKTSLRTCLLKNLSDVRAIAHAQLKLFCETVSIKQATESR
ncbi:MAG: hypothetical protein RR271_07775, partial [Oscillospiraceae bacterium]